MRAVILAAATLFFAATAAFAEDRKIEDFYGRYLGQGTEEAFASTATSAELQTRFSEVTITKTDDGDGFTIKWATLKLKGNEVPREADTKAYSQTFRATDNPLVFREETSGDPLKGAAASWAHINGNTLAIIMVQVEPNGGYFVTQYDRTLTDKGMDVRFTRFENGAIVRAVQLSLLKGPKITFGH